MSTSLDAPTLPTPSTHGGRLRARSWARGAAFVVFALVGILLGALAAALAVLSQGPIALSSVARAVEAQLGAVLGPEARIRIDGAELLWQPDLGLTLRLSGVTAEDSRLGLSAAVAIADLGMTLVALLSGAPVPRTIFLRDTEMAVSTRAVLQTEARTDNRDPPLDAAVRSLRGILDDVSADGLERLRMSGGRLIVRHETRSGHEIQREFKDVELDATFGRLPAPSQIVLSARGAVSRWSVTLAREADESSGERLTVRGTDLDLRDFVVTSADDFDVTFPFYPTFSVAIDGQGHPRSAEMNLVAGAGLFRFGPDAEDRIRLDEGEAQLAWSAGENVLRVRSLRLQAGETELAFGGSIAPPGGSQGAWTAELALLRGRMAPRDVPGPPLALTDGRLRASYRGEPGLLELETLQAAAEGTTLSARGSLRLGQGARALDLSVDLDRISTAAAKRLWPHFVAPGARTWFIEHVEGGRFEGGRIGLSLPRLADPPAEWPRNAVKLAFRAKGATVRVLGRLPEVVGVDARIALAERRFDVEVDRASVATRFPQRPILSAFSFTIPDALKKLPRGQARFQIAGDTAAIAEIANAEPLEALEDTGLKPGALLGTTNATVTVELPLEAEPKASSVLYRVEAQLDGFGSREPIAGRQIAEGKLKLVVDPAAATITGKAQINGIPADVNFVEARREGKADRRDMKMMLDEASRTRLGIDLGGLVSGPLGLSVEQNPADPARKRITADLGPARLSLAPIGWTKGPGVGGRAVFDLVENDKNTRIDNLTIESEGLQIRGTVQLDAARRPSLIDLSRFALRKGDDAKLQIRRGDQGTVAILEAKSFDVRSLLDRGRGTGTTEPTDPRLGSASDLTVKIRAARLVGFNDVVLVDAVVDATLQNGSPSRLSLTARTQAGGTVEATIVPDKGVRRLNLTSNDAGSVLAFLDIYPRMRSGVLRVNGTLGGPGTADGKLVVTGFRLLGEEAVKRLAERRTTQAPAEGVRVKDVDPGGTEFDRLSLDFAYRGGILTISDAVARGTSVGAVAAGRIDLNKGRLEITGTYIPAFALNNLVSQIPIVGIIAGAGRDEGLLGVTFKMTGPVDEPYLVINPMSAIAPGIFRKVFEFN